jgi:hypothetical protein
MDLLRTILVGALVVIAGLAAWLLLTAADTSQPINPWILALLAVALLAIAYLFVWRGIGSVLALVAGAGALLYGLAFAWLLDALGGDPLLEIGVVLPGAVTVIVATIDLLVLYFRRGPADA